MTADTPMADMEYDDILKCLPEEKRKELLDKRFSFAEQTGIEGILDKSTPDLWSEEYMKSLKSWSKDWEHFDWKQVHEKLCRAKAQRQAGKEVDNPDLGITLDELKEYFEWLYDTHPETYFKAILYIALVQAGISPDKADILSNYPDKLEAILNELH